MKKIVSSLFLIIFVILLIPYMVTMLMTGTKPSVSRVIPYDGRVVISEHDNYTITYDYSQYLTGVTARILITFSGHGSGDDVFSQPEFVKVCAILANTFLTNEFAKSNTITDDFLRQHHITNEELKTLWGDLYETNQNAIAAAISETNGLVITHNGQVATPFYHFISNGNTRIRDDLTFLKSANTNEDLEEPGFLTVHTFTENQFMETLNSAIETPLPSDTSVKEIFQVTERDNLGYVTQLQLGNVILSGDTFVQIFGLNSPAFTVTFQDNSLKIITKGCGHGYGISLTYALRLARNGNTYTDIINYFYNNVEIKNIK